MGDAESTSFDCAYDPLSMGDPAGGIFRFNGEVLRGIRPGQAQFYLSLLRDKTVERLVGKRLLIETTLSDLHLAAFDAVVRHRQTPVLSYPYEWCAPMLKKAALLVIDLSRELARDGLTLRDAHPRNVLFDNCARVWVDLCSIVRTPDGEQWPAYDQYMRLFLFPLGLLAAGRPKIARLFLKECDEEIASEEALHVSGAAGNVGQLRKRARRILKRVLPSDVRRLAKATVHRLDGSSRTIGPGDRIEMFQRLREQVEAIRLPEAETTWSGYYDSPEPHCAASNDWDPKQATVNNILSDIKPITVLDIGCNAGWYAHLSSLRGASVVAFDTDETCVSRLFRNSESNGLRILPLIANMLDSSSLFHFCARPANERLRCDMGLALAVVHHLVFKKHLRFENIVSILSSYVNKWLVVEFVPADDQYVSQWMSAEHSWYSTDSFVAVLRKSFSKVTVFPSSPEPRLLFLCEK